MHSQNTAVVVRTGIKAGGWPIRDLNHNQAVTVRTGVKAGGINLSNHAQTVIRS